MELEIYFFLSTFPNFIRQCYNLYKHLVVFKISLHYLKLINLRTIKKNLSRSEIMCLKVDFEKMVANIEVWLQFLLYRIIYKNNTTKTLLYFLELILLWLK